MFSGCIHVGGPNCNNAYCMPPDVCCKGTCYHQCPANTAIDENCACVVLMTVPTPIPPTYIPPQVTNPALGKPEGLLVWYDFEDDFTSTGFVSDRSGNNRDAEINGDISTSSGISGGRSIRFTGRGYIQAPDNPAALRKNVTFAFWFRTNDPDANYKMASAAWWNGGPGSGWTMATHVPEFWAEDTEGVLLRHKKTSRITLSQNNGTTKWLRMMGGISKNIPTGTLSIPGNHGVFPWEQESPWQSADGQILGSIISGNWMISGYMTMHYNLRIFRHCIRKDCIKPGNNAMNGDSRDLHWQG